MGTKMDGAWPLAIQIEGRELEVRVGNSERLDEGRRPLRTISVVHMGRADVGAVAAGWKKDNRFEHRVERRGMGDVNTGS